MDPKYLLKLAKTRMPFGKYEGSRLVDLPEAYVVWFSKKGFPVENSDKCYRPSMKLRLTASNTL